MLISFICIAFIYKMLLHKDFQCCSACKKPHTASSALKPQLWPASLKSYSSEQSLKSHFHLVRILFRFYFPFFILNHLSINYTMCQWEDIMRFLVKGAQDLVQSAFNLLDIIKVLRCGRQNYKNDLQDSLNSVWHMVSGMNRWTEYSCFNLVFWFSSLGFVLWLSLSS